jgi:hypothetical protein
MNRIPVIFAFILMLSVGSARANTPSASPPTPPLSAAHIGATPNEATLMGYAQTGLASARENLLHVTGEYGGHRAKATQAINTALQELKLAQQADKH